GLIEQPRVHSGLRQRRPEVQRNSQYSRVEPGSPDALQEPGQRSPRALAVGFGQCPSWAWDAGPVLSSGQPKWEGSPPPTRTMLGLRLAEDGAGNRCKQHLVRPRRQWRATHKAISRKSG